eukprot:m.411672 g.411672  ORF g.411672 m.411672 type:complete len:348 (+) comp28715_c0_seq1:136-1179(+)
MVVIIISSTPGSPVLNFQDGGQRERQICGTDRDSWADWMFRSVVVVPVQRHPPARLAWIHPDRPIPPDLGLLGGGSGWAPSAQRCRNEAVTAALATGGGPARGCCCWGVTRLVSTTVDETHSDAHEHHNSHGACSGWGCVLVLPTGRCHFSIGRNDGRVGPLARYLHRKEPLCQRHCDLLPRRLLGHVDYLRYPGLHAWSDTGAVQSPRSEAGHSNALGQVHPARPGQSRRALRQPLGGLGGLQSNRNHAVLERDPVDCHRACADPVLYPVCRHLLLFPPQDVSCQRVALPTHSLVAPLDLGTLRDVRHLLAPSRILDWKRPSRCNGTAARWLAHDNHVALGMFGGH